MQPHRACRRYIIQAQVTVKYIFRTHPQLISDKPGKKPRGIQFGIDTAYHREHILLLRQRIALVDTTVEMYGQVRDGEQRTVKTHQPYFWIEHIFPTEGHTSGY